MGTTEGIASRVREIVREGRWNRERIVWVSGSKAGQRSDVLSHLEERDGWSHVNIGLKLSEQLLDIPARKRPVQARKKFRALLREAEEQSTNNVVGLDHLEMLFSPVLELDVFGLLKGEAVNRTLIVSWCGRIEEGDAVYAEPSHPEYCTNSVPEHAVVRVDDVGA
jgi:hypothetical protein